MKTAVKRPVKQSTELATIEPPKEPTLISITETTVAELKASLSSVSLAGVLWMDGSFIVQDSDAMLADKGGLKVVRDSRMRAVKARTTCEKEHKIIKEEALRECQRIDKSRRDLVAAIEAIEKPLLALEEAVEDELDRRQKAAADALYTARRNLLLEVAGPDFGSVDEQLLRSVADDDTFMRLKEQCLDNKRRMEEAEAERARQAAEAARLAEANRIAAEKLAEDRRKFEAEQAEASRVRKVEQDRIDAEQRERSRIENERLAAERKAFEEQQAEAARQRKIEQDNAAVDRIVQAEKDRLARAAIEAERRTLEEERQRLADDKAKRDAEANRQRLAAEQEVEPREGLISFAEPTSSLTPEFIAAADIESETPITIGASRTDAELIDVAEETVRDDRFDWCVSAAQSIVDHFGSKTSLTSADVATIAGLIQEEFQAVELY